MRKKKKRKYGHFESEVGDRRRGKRGSRGDAGICFFLQLTKEEVLTDRPTAKEAYYIIWEIDARSQADSSSWETSKREGGSRRRPHLWLTKGDAKSPSPKKERKRKRDLSKSSEIPSSPSPT